MFHRTNNNVLLNLNSTSVAGCIPAKMNVTICTTKHIISFVQRLFLILLISLQSLQAQQVTEKSDKKISPTLRLKFMSRLQSKEVSLFTISVTSIKDFNEWIKFRKDVIILSIYTPANTVIIKCTNEIANEILKNKLVVWIDEKQAANEELLTGVVDYSANRITTIQKLYPQLNGNSISVSIKEQLFDSTDIDFKGRVLPSAYSAINNTSHASLMATIIAGGGNAWYNTKGAAWKSKISSASFTNLLPEPNSYYQTAILLQNHSYGTVIESYYGAEAAAYDVSAVSNPSTLHLFFCRKFRNFFSNYRHICKHYWLCKSYRQF